MFIVSFGSALAPNKIGSEDLRRAGSTVPSDAPTIRSSIVSSASDLLQKSARARLLESSENPTSLGHKAVVSALSGASIGAEELGLIIGDSATPVQTTPSEAQRVGSALRVKVPAYDITGASAANIIHLDNVRKWKQERVPRYVCCFSSSTVTHAADYNDGQSTYFADGASAAIVSVVQKGRFKVVDTVVVTSPASLSGTRLHKLGGLEIEKDFISKFVRPSITKTISEIAQRYSDTVSNAYLVQSQLASASENHAATELGFASDRILSLETEEGDLFGANPFAVMTKFQNHFKAGDSIFLIAAGVGVSGAYALLTVEE